MGVETKRKREKQPACSQTVSHGVIHLLPTRLSRFVYLKNSPCGVISILLIYGFFLMAASMRLFITRDEPKKYFVFWFSFATFFLP